MKCTRINEGQRYYNLIHSFSMRKLWLMETIFVLNFGSMEPKGYRAIEIIYYSIQLERGGKHKLEIAASGNKLVESLNLIDMYNEKTK